MTVSTRILRTLGAVVLVLVLAVPLLAADRYVSRPAGVQLDVPEGWGLALATPESVRFVGPDATLIEVFVAEPDPSQPGVTIERALADLGTWLGPGLQDVVFDASLAEQREVNGLKGVLVSGTAKVDGAAVTFEAAVMLGLKPIIVLTHAEGTALDEAVAQQLRAVVDSMTPYVAILPPKPVVGEDSPPAPTPGP